MTILILTYLKNNLLYMLNKFYVDKLEKFLYKAKEFREFLPQKGL